MRIFAAFCILGTLLNALQVSAQQRYTEKDKRKTFPVIGHGSDSPLPDSIHIIGTIAEDPARGVCGTYCTGGTVKVKLKDAISGYNSEYVYLITACLSVSVKKDAQVDVVASKYRNDVPVYECYYYTINNKFDSGGLPFYKLSEQETDKMEK
jgi:hypothetical protein